MLSIWETPTQALDKLQGEEANVVHSQWENVHLYYDLITVAVIGDVHSIKLIINIPLRTADQNFNLHKLIAMPTWINLLNTIQNILILGYQQV